MQAISTKLEVMREELERLDTAVELHCSDDANLQRRLKARVTRAQELVILGTERLSGSVLSFFFSHSFFLNTLPTRISTDHL